MSGKAFNTAASKYSENVICFDATFCLLSWALRQLGKDCDTTELMRFLEDIEWNRVRGLNSQSPKLRPRWPSGKVSTAGPQSQVRNPIPLKIRRVWSLLHDKSYVVAKRPPVGVTRKFGEGVPVQVSSSSADCDSKLRCPSLKNP
ncbi:hypothetical protein AVEN_265164-1 [Araneus ventricosus]|uniref:Uncharacterized protein n=1 Tax=Araneus ventricosus TaxID=182803 RepID=A0A4Y2CNU8_ARAVE|nr:hypothetical protein AVEN_265164-1 [Araneus ventricosus]